MKNLNSILLVSILLFALSSILAQPAQAFLFQRSPFGEGIFLPACVEHELPPPPTLTFSAAPSAIGRGGTSLLTWTSDAVSCIGDCRNPGLCDDWDPNILLDAGTYKQPTGSQTVKPAQTATYRLTCFGSGSPPASTYKDVTVSVSTFKFREIIPRLFPFIQKVFGYSQ